MQKVLAAIAFLAATLAPNAAPSATGMAAMQYYVGNWTCIGGDVGQKPVNATLTYTLDDGVLREWIYVAAQGKMKSPYAQNSTTTYDSKNGRFVQVNLSNEVAWSVVYAKPWAGNVELWTDHETSSGKLERGETTRNSQGSFTYLGYPTVTATKPNFRATCRRST
jgi:hypothetical protein